jgi:serine phosphatase RsbU (regulator of sigma subunit)
MSVKTKIIIGFVLIFLMIFLQSLMISFLNKRQAQLTDEAMAIYRSTLTLRDKIVDLTNLRSDIQSHILQNLEIPEDSWVRLSGIMISKRLLKWQSQFVKSDEFKILDHQQQLNIREMRRFLTNIDDTIYQIRDEPSQAQKIKTYDRDLVNYVTIIQNLMNEIVDKNTVEFTRKNRNITDYVSRVNIYQNLIIAGSILIIIFAMLYANKVLKPISLLIEGVSSIKNGDLSTIVPKITNDEFGVLTEQFNEMSDEIKNHRDHLEELVEERTQQLSDANKELEQAYYELKSTHNELKEARRIADLDMKMAVNVQSSFLMKSPPPSNDWDAAFLFRPMSGVSGDMYDFYLADDGTLVGASLMDISGHGISSGLLTMIAKSTIYRHFMEGYEQELKLNQTMVRINSELISEFNNMDKYLTGIILKFNDRIVEYVNAGHPELIIKKHDNQRSFIVAPKNQEYKARFLGLEAMRFSERDVRPIRFTVKKGDVLCMFSDCLNESLNKENKEFGIQGVMSALNSSGENDSADEVLNHIISNLYRWIGSDKMKDDLTIMVLRKK